MFTELLANSRGRLSTVDLLVLISLDKLLSKTLHTFFTKTSYTNYTNSYTNEEFNCTEPSLQLVFLGKIIVRHIVEISKEA